MREIVEKLFEHRKLEETTRSKSIDSLCKELEKIIDTSHRRISIYPDLQNGVAILKYEDTGEEYSISPGIVDTRDVRSSTALSINNYPGAVLKGDTFYDSSGNRIGKALVRVSKNYTPPDYSPNVKDATISKKIVQ